ncbi:MAG: cyclic nucleotide-binding domain-containing protein [Elusimicrobia bacterium]|nr:cyclic nucleotide-binding domain-containing protein [Elusimicrobiota bacterium]
MASTAAEKLKLLKSLRLFDRVPERQLEALAEFLKPKTLGDGEVIFEEGSVGTSLYFISQGSVRISKETSGGSFKDLAFLRLGDSFGEMALLDEVKRSARASAAGQTVILELDREELRRWLKSRPELAVDFFSQLVQLQSRRLRTTSRELALLFDLANLFLEPIPSQTELLQKALDRILPHLENPWSAIACLYNIFNEEMELAAAFGSLDPAALAPKLPPPTHMTTTWIEPNCCYSTLPGPERPQGYLVLRCDSPLSDDERSEIGQILGTAAKLLGSALENIRFRAEEAMRARLDKASQNYGTSI